MYGLVGFESRVESVLPMLLLVGYFLWIVLSSSPYVMIFMMVVRYTRVHARTFVGGFASLDLPCLFWKF